MNIKENLNRLKKEIPDDVTLVAVSKTIPEGDIQLAYDAGQRVFGENKVQELAHKYEILPKDIQWHLIGHLQTNKVKFIASFVDLIHSVDSYKLLKTIEKEAIKKDRVIDCLLQVYIAGEESKFGFSQDELEDMLERDEFSHLSHVRVKGLMGMASFTDDMEQVRREFEHLAGFFKSIQNKFYKNNPYFKVISMGMSGDYPIAIECGSTMVRIGTSIFGERNYNN